MLFHDSAAGDKKAIPAADDVSIKDSSSASFIKDVVEASRQATVLVDFWAPWCGPCKTLGPILEKIVAEAKGALRLVKINVDRDPGLAEQMHIQSIPAVYAFQGGRPVDGFVGQLPESQIREFVKRLNVEPAGTEAIAEALATANALLNQGDLPSATRIYDRLLAEDPVNAAAAAGIASCLVRSGRIAAARQMLSEMPPELANSLEVTAVKTAIELAEQAKALGPTADLARRLAADPDDHAARYDLALACYAQNQREKAIDELMELFRRDRKWHDEAARKQLVKLFEVMGPSDPLTMAARKRLSSLMFA